MTALKLKIKKRQTLADQLYGQVLEQIVSNKLAQGEKLPSENQIATAFGVSRPVVREASRCRSLRRGSSLGLFVGAGSGASLLRGV